MRDRQTATCARSRQHPRWGDAQVPQPLGAYSYAYAQKGPRPFLRKFYSVTFDAWEPDFEVVAVRANSFYMDGLAGGLRERNNRLGGEVERYPQYVPSSVLSSAPYLVPILSPRPVRPAVRTSMCSSPAPLTTTPTLRNLPSSDGYQCSRPG